MKKVTLDKYYKGGHKYTFTYIKVLDKFCPNCGKKDLWNESGSGDYYLGSDYICLNCKTTSYLDNSCNKPYDDFDLRFIDDLKNGTI